MKKNMIVTLATLTIIGLVGCQPKDYGENKSGLIEAGTLSSYISNWQQNKPKGTDGKLIIVQAGATSTGKFLKHDDKNVLVYQIPAGGACDPSYNRHDGIANIPGALLAGPYVDGMISTFNMDPEKDFIVFAVGEGSTGMREIVRSWWVLTYWGWPKERLAFLNGSVSYTFSKSSGLAKNLVEHPNMPPVKLDSTGKPVMHNGKMIPIAPFYSMKSLNNLQTDLQIYIKDMMDIAENSKNGNYFIADARGTKEYTAEKNSRTAAMTCGSTHDKQCFSPIQGHIHGAVDFPYTDTLVMNDQKEDLNGDGIVDKKDASYKFKSPIELEKLYKEKGYKNGNKVITYCRTGRKSTLVALTAYAVLKYPVAMYDGSWIQWGEMANRVDSDDNEILQEGSHLRTDIAKYTDIVKYVEPAYTQPSAAYEIKLDATDSQNIVEEDKLYMKK